MTNIKTQQQIDVMAEGGRRLAGIMAKLEEIATVGITTNELNSAASVLVLESGSEPAFLGYNNFPGVLCTSINSQIVHTAPSNYQLKAGDILKLDLGIKYKGFCSDMAITIAIKNEKDEFDFEAMRLIKATKKALKFGIKKAKVSNTTGDIGNTIQRFIEGQGFNVVRSLCGHGIGTKVHEDPQIPDYGKRGKGDELKEGMVICIEPMVAMGDATLVKVNDGHGLQTRDGSLTAHFEHTIAILKNGPKVLTAVK